MFGVLKIDKKAREAVRKKNKKGKVKKGGKNC
jgi:hypothetical protein